MSCTILWRTTSFAPQDRAGHRGGLSRLRRAGSPRSRRGVSGGPSTMSVLVSNRQDSPVGEVTLAALAERTLVAEGRPGVELSLSFVGEEEMADLHIRYMDEPGPTDVLSFPMD